MAGGRPPKFETAEEMQDLITSYFEGLVYVDGDGVEQYRPALITGLALALGFCSRESIYEYEKKPEFTYTIKRAKMMVEADYERRLDGKACTGSIFALKNMGWKDKTEVDNTNYNTEIELTEDQKREAINNIVKRQKEFDDYK